MSSSVPRRIKTVIALPKKLATEHTKSVALFCRASQWGLSNDKILVEQILKEQRLRSQLSLIHTYDPLLFGEPVAKPASKEAQTYDIALYFEVPCRLAFSYASRNIVIVNPEWWSLAWNDWVFSDRSVTLVFKCEAHRTLFTAAGYSGHSVVIPWRAPPIMTSGATATTAQWLYIVGASKHKLTAAQIVLAAWQREYPPLLVWGSVDTIKILRDSVPKHLHAHITLDDIYHTTAEKEAAQRASPVHVCASVAEGFGYTFAEAASHGAIPLWTDLPVYMEVAWGAKILGNIGCIKTAPSVRSQQYLAAPVTFGPEDVAVAVRSILRAPKDTIARLKSALPLATQAVTEQFRTSWRRVISSLLSSKRIATQIDSVAPIITPLKPMVAVVTLTYNRPRWWHNMMRNILICKYPRDRLIWIVVDDSSPEGRIDIKMSQFEDQFKTHFAAIKYISLPKRMSIGEKRNRGCIVALSYGAEIVTMMDDDDFYPPESVDTRVRWLLNERVRCVYCSAISMYDIGTYNSAMNVPPLTLPVAQRVSEATLTFTADFFTERQFDAVGIAEGESFLRDRIADTAEISPVGVIVSFLHGANTSARTIPVTGEPNGCHYGFDDKYFEYLHANFMTQVAIAATSSSSGSSESSSASSSTTSASSENSSTTSGLIDS